MIDETEQKVRDHFADREQEVASTPFQTIWQRAAIDQTANSKGRRQYVGAIAAGVLAIGLAAVIWNNEQSAQFEEEILLTEVTTNTLWRAPSDRITTLELSDWGTPNLAWPDNRITRLGAIEEIKL